MSLRRLCGILDFVLSLAEDDPEKPLRLPELIKGVAVVDLELVAIALDERRPVITIWNAGLPTERRSRLFVGHLQKEQISELLDVVAVGQAVVAEDVAVVPEFLNQLVGLIGHVGMTLRYVIRVLPWLPSRMRTW